MTEQALHQVKIDWKMEYAVHGGERLTGNLYRPEGMTDVPVVVAVHGGAWKAGDALNFQYWGPWLAARGIAVYSIEYRLAGGGKNLFPASVLDVRAAVQFLRANAAKLGLDGARVALMGASAGAHLSAFVALAGEKPPYNTGEPQDPHVGVNTAVKAVVVAYGVFDMLASWKHDLVVRPYDQPTEIYLGASAVEDKFRYFAASPIAHATRHANKTSFFVTWGADDDVVDWTNQSQPFVVALKQAGYYVRIAPVPAAPHFWMYDPIDEPHGFAGSVAPKVLRFLRERL